MDDSAFDVDLQEADHVRGTIKCGAIQLNLEKLAFSFACIYCESELNSIRQFVSHFQQHLVMTEAENEVFIQNTEEDSESPQSVDESLHDVPSDEENVEVSTRDYQIEMLEMEDSNQDTIEFMSNNEHTEDQFVYQVRYATEESETHETHVDESLQPNNIEISKSEVEEAPDLGFDIVSEVTQGNSTKSKGKKDVNYVCEICGIKFTEASTLQVHRQRHNRCQLCLMTFSSKMQLKQHIKTHVAQKSFVCEECGQSYKSAESLANHQRRHVTEQFYLCNTCGKSFYEERALREHILIHTSARPFICKECNMTFSRQKALMLHAMMHTDVRKFSCLICRMTFAQNSGLLSHMKEKHHSNFSSGD